MTNRYLKVLLVLLGCSSLLLITACSKEAEQQLSLVDAARLIEKAEIAVNVDSLSDTIIKRQENYRLFDVRPAEEYRSAHIKTAENISGTELLAVDRLDSLKSGRDIYLYSSRSDKAAQLAALLRTRSVPAYYLQGGYQAWARQMVNASGSVGSASTQAKQQAVSCWFEGDYVAEAGLAAKTGGYVPPLEPVAAEPQAPEDPLGLGLGLGLGPEGAREPAAEQPSEDPLGLGLGIGLGPEGAQKPESAPSGGTLRIGEGC